MPAKIGRAQMCGAADHQAQTVGTKGLAGILKRAFGVAESTTKDLSSVGALAGWDPSLGNYTKHVRQSAAAAAAAHVSDKSAKPSGIRAQDLAQDLVADPAQDFVADMPETPVAGHAAVRRKLYRMLRGSSYLLKDLDRPGKDRQRVTTCRFAVVSKVEPVFVMHGESRAWYEGLQVCGSVWSCPVCSDRISKIRKDEANEALHYARENKLHVHMVTMTASHQLGDDLRQLKETMTAAWRKMQRRRDWATLKKTDLVGTIRVLEVTHGAANGWHPHFHMIVLAKRNIETELQALAGSWVTSLEAVGMTASLERGWDVQDGGEAGSYLAKWGAAEELAFHGRKRGRNGSRTAFQLLADYTEKGDKRAGELFREFAVAFKGSQQMVWSAGLKTLVGVEELDDEEAAKDAPKNDEPESEIRATVSYDQWRGDRVAGRHGVRERRIVVLDAAEKSAETCRFVISKNIRDDDLWFDDEDDFVDGLIEHEHIMERAKARHGDPQGGGAGDPTKLGSG